MTLGWPRALVAAALVVASAPFLAACSVDPTAAVFAITFRNDTGRDVHLKLCAGDGCHDFDYSDSWKAGQSAEENISADSKLVTRWLIQDDASGRSLGCLVLTLPRKYKHVVIRMTQAVPCPGRQVIPLDQISGAGT